MAPARASTWRPRAHFGIPRTWFVPRQGAPTVAPAALSTWRPRAHFGTPLTRFAPHRGAPHIAPAGASTFRPRAHFGMILTRFVPLRELHQWPPRVRPHCVHAPISAHRPHVSRPPESLTNVPGGCVHNASARTCRHTPHTSRAPQGSSINGPGGCVHVASPRPFRYTPHQVAPPRERHQWPQRVRPHGVPTPMSAHSQTSRPPRALHPWPHRARPHGAPAPISAHPSHVWCPPENSTCGPSRCAHMAPPRPCRTPRMFRATQGPPPMAPAGASAWRPRAHVGTPITCFEPPRELHRQRGH